MITETFIFNEIDQLQRNGWQINVFTMQNHTRSGYDPCVYSPKSLDLFSGFLRIISTPFHILRLYKHVIEEHQKKYKGIIGICRFIRNCILSFLFSDIIRKNKILHIHAHFGFIATDIAIMVSYLTGIPYSVSLHSHDIYTNQCSFSVNIHHAKFVITCTEYNKQFINTHTQSIYSKKIFKVYHGVDLNIWKFHHHDNFSNTNIEILTVARLVEKKGLIYLINGVRLLVNTGYSVTLTIVGDGSLRNDLSNYIRKNHLQDSVHIKGWQSVEAIKALMDGSDIFVLPCVISSNGDRDGLPNSIAEAMAAGLPVISTYVSAIPELVTDHITGILVAEKNSEAIASAIIELINNPVLYKNICTNARKCIEENFDLKNCITSLETAFQKSFVNERE